MGKIAQKIILLFTFGVVTACATLTEDHGYVPDQALLEQIIIGKDTKETAGRILGRPSTQGVIDDNGWYYVKSDYERFLWRAPVEVNREVVLVSFSAAGVVANVERFGLDDGQVVVLSRRVTETSTQGVGVLAQIFGNIGQVDAGTIFGDN